MIIKNSLGDGGGGVDKHSITTVAVIDFTCQTLLNLNTVKQTAFINVFTFSVRM